jgi:hypothetical protein
MSADDAGRCCWPWQKRARPRKIEQIEGIEALFRALDVGNELNWQCNGELAVLVIELNWQCRAEACTCSVNRPDAGQMLAEMLEMLGQMLGPLRCWLRCLRCLAQMLGHMLAIEMPVIEIECSEQQM